MALSAHQNRNTTIDVSPNSLVAHTSISSSSSNRGIDKLYARWRMLNAVWKFSIILKSNTYNIVYSLCCAVQCCAVLCSTRRNGTSLPRLWSENFAIATQLSSIRKYKLWSKCSQLFYIHFVYIVVYKLCMCMVFEWGYSWTLNNFNKFSLEKVCVCVCVDDGGLLLHHNHADSRSAVRLHRWTKSFLLSSQLTQQ